jgi:enoyl-CoA hydratase
MVEELAAALRRWTDDPVVSAVVIDGAGERGLCAGGDVKRLYTAVRQGASAHSQEQGAIDFWAAEYEMNALIADFTPTTGKPLVALMDGIVMGGGWGVSVHASARVVTPRSVLAMPETAIGLVPDVGSLYWLSRMPGGVGMFAALTGARLNAGDAVEFGLADSCASAESTALSAAIVDNLRSGPFTAEPWRIVPPPPSIGPGERAWIDECFTAPSVPEIADRLAGRSERGAIAALDTLRAMSPSCVLVAFEALNRARQLPTVAAVLAQDLRVSAACARHPDLTEGIRAMLIDRDRTPQWSPPRWEDVSASEVDAYFG